ncbi:AraC family transcriptional regulator [Sphingobacterium sp. Mn56C]|uniref:AraC family transcriptional regulator n=1 Tax=Sphingobacterium sp. Mn56C TaxID=3395261 RepID=UPI003BD57F1F
MPLIPIQSLTQEPYLGISVKHIVMDSLQDMVIANQAHRHDFHFFLLQEKGQIEMEVDFEKQNSNAGALIYIHPNQVHRFVGIEKASAYILGIKNENLQADYMALLHDIHPQNTIQLNAEGLSLLKDAISLCLKLSTLQNQKLLSAAFKNSCNTFIALALAQYLERLKPFKKPTRFENITKDFTHNLNTNFNRLKRPRDYALQLHISTPYLNECVRTVTGLSVSEHINQRIILEAKRLLYHTSKSVKEIATELGYDNFTYFSRFFRKQVGMTALAFRQKNFD